MMNMITCHCILDKILGYMKEIGIENGKGFQGHEGVDMFWEGQQIQLEWISKDKSSSAVAN